VYIATSEESAMQRAIDRIRGITAEAEPGRIYKGTVRKIVDFGAFVEILRAPTGCCTFLRSVLAAWRGSPMY